MGKKYRNQKTLKKQSHGYKYMNLDKIHWLGVISRLDSKLIDFLALSGVILG